MNPLHTRSGVKISTGYIRIVHGDRGSYYEISPEQIIKENIEIPTDKTWKYDNEKVYYIEYRTKDISAVKVYFQKRPVDYADYIVGYYYVSIRDVRSTHSKTITSFIQK